jgi:hypothetical protein
MHQSAMPALSWIELSLGLSLLLILGILILAGFWMIRNGQLRREWEHAERMRALEMGMPVPPRESAWAKALVCVAIGLGVPVIAFSITLAAYERPGAADELWVAPAVVSGLSVISATLLGGFLFVGGAKAGSTAPRGQHPGVKPVGDPDAIDVVGRRG